MKPVLKNSDNSNTSSEFPARMNVLLIDGNQESLHRLEIMLKECDYEVQKCNQGKEALKLLNDEGSKKKFDIILTERCMPDINEFQLIGTLSKISDLAPVIVMSKSGNNNTIKDCIKYGAYDYLVKPIQREEVKKLWIPAFRQRIKMCNEVPQTDEKKKIRRVWSLDENEKFVEIYEEVKKRGGRPTPKLMIETLNGKGLKDLTQREVASKLQKHRKKIGEVGTSSNQLNLSTQHLQDLAAGSMSLGPHKITPNFQNVQVNVDHSITDKMTQTLSSHERPCNEMSNIIQDQVTAGNVAGINFFRPSDVSDRDLHEALEHMLGAKDLSKGHPNPNISQDQAGAENVAGNYSFMPNINTSLQSSSQDCNNNMDYTLCGVHNPEFNERLPSFMFEDGTGEANNIQDQAAAENVAGNCSFMPNINTSLQSSSQDCNNNMDYTLCGVHNPEFNEGLLSFMFEDGTGEANNIQEQAVGNYLTPSPWMWPGN